MSSRRETAVQRSLREAEPMRGWTCGRCGGTDAVLFAVPPVVGTLACPNCSGPRLMAMLEAANAALQEANRAAA